MQDLNDTPKHDSLTTNIQLQHKQHKEEVARNMIENIVEEIFIPFEGKPQVGSMLNQ